VKLRGRPIVEAGEESQTQDRSRLCPECGTPVSTRATTCAICGHDFIAAQQAARKLQAEQEDEAAQRPVRAIVIGLSAAVALLLIVALYLRNRAEAIAALTPTATPTPTMTPTASLTPTPTPTLPFTSTPVPPREYIVQPGDNIFYIADIFEVDYRDILAFNNLSENSILQVSQTILIPPPTPTPTPSPTPPESTPVLSPTPKGVIHIVESGETLITIAEIYGVQVSAILSANNIENADQIRAGDQLVIPQGDTPSSEPAQSTPTPLPSYGPILLLQPLDGSRIVGTGKTILLQWLSVGILREDETYRVTVDQLSGEIRWGPVYIKATSIHLPNDLFPAPSDPNREFRWTVTIMRQVGVGSDDTPLYEVISPAALRVFQWLPSPPTPTLTPVPSP